MLTLSQGHLALLDTCPRKFQHAYLDQLRVPAPPQALERQRWGSQFHQLMQQRELGLPIEGLPPDDPALQDCVEALVATAPELFEPVPGRLRQSEHPRMMEFEGVLLTAIYDLLLLDADAAEVVDWKTHQHPDSKSTSRANLARQWQSRLYLFLLAETTGIPPEQLRMSYWFVRHRDPQGTLAPQQVRLPYSAAQHRQTQADLQRLISQLHQLQDTGYFPQVDDPRCLECPFAYRCQRLPDSGLPELPPVATIAEVPLPPWPEASASVSVETPDTGS